MLFGEVFVDDYSVNRQNIVTPNTEWLVLDKSLQCKYMEVSCQIKLKNMMIRVSNGSEK